MLSKKSLLNYLPVFLIIVLASVLRLLWLDKIPNAISGDELVYIITAKSIAVSGSDLTGSWDPFSVFLFNFPPGQGQAELLYFLLFPIVGFTNFSLFAARFTGAIFGVLTVYLIFLTGSKIFNKQIGVIAGLVAAINPWFIYISRTSYEANIAMFFFTLAFYGFLSWKGKKILLLIPVLFLAFYSYIGTKVIFLPFVLVLIYYSHFYLNSKKFKKEYLLVLLSSSVLFIVYIFSVFLHPDASRLGSIFLPGDPSVIAKVNGIRALSIENPLTNLFVNRFTVYIQVLLVKFFTIFSSNYLFLNGDRFFSIFTHGVFYYLDAVFLLFGMVFIFLKNRKSFFVLMSLILIAIIPQLIYESRTDNFTPHFTLIFPFLIFFIAFGIWETINYFKNKKYFFLSSFLISLVYFLLLINFLNIYFYQWPLQGNFDFPIRLISKYANLAKGNGKSVSVYSTGSYDIFLKYIFYSNSLNTKSYNLIKEDILRRDYELGGVKFLDCNSGIDMISNKDVILYDSSCLTPVIFAKKLTVARLSDGGESFRIYNDRICGKYNLKKYPSDLSINDFSIENQSAKNFCETFITRL